MKTIAKNTAYNVIYKLINILFPLITSAKVARVFLAEDIGEFYAAQNYVSYYVFLAGLGLANYGIREIGKVQTNKKERSRVVSELFAINTLSTSVCLLVFIASILFTPFFRQKNIYLYMISGLSIIFNFFQLDWYYQGIEEYAYITKRSFFIKIVSFLAIMGLINKREDLILYAFFSVFANGANQIWNVINIRKSISIKGLSLRKLEIKKHLKPALMLFTTALSVELYTKVDISMVEYFSGNEAVGYYNYAIKIVQIVISLTTAVAMVFLPRLSYYYGNNQTELFKKQISQISKLIILITLPLTVGLSMVAKETIVIMYGQGFERASSTLRIQAWLALFTAIGYVYGTQVLVTVGQEKKLMISTIIGAVINLSVNAVLIPRYAQDGAAIASVISEIIVFGIQYYFAKPYLNGVSTFGKSTLNAIFASGIMALSVYSVRFFVTGNILRLFTSVILGGVTYIAILLIFRTEEIRILLKYIKNKIK